MIKSAKDGKWYPTKAKMLEAEQKAEQKKVELQPLQEAPTSDNHKPFEKRMQQVSTIISMKEKGKDAGEIATKLWIAKSYVEEVLQKGYEQMETELRAMYHIPADAPRSAQNTEGETEEMAKTKEVKEPKVKKEKIQKEKTGLTDTQRKDTILEILKDNPSGVKAKDIFLAVNDKLTVENKKTTYYQLLGKMKEAKEISLDTETKLYSVV